MTDSFNVVWILCDELRADAIGRYGHADVTVRTPAIDHLAERGTVFTRCYVSSPVCVSSRASMLTGRLPHETGIYGNEAVWPSAPEVPLEQRRTVVDAFTDAGWAAANFGKVHVPAPMARWPHHDPTGSEMTAPLSGLSDGEAQVVRSPGPRFTVAGRLPTGRRFHPSAVTDRAIRWIANTDQPFFIRVSYLQPHTPVVTPQPFAEMYRDQAFRDCPMDLSKLSEFERAFAAVNDVESLDGATMVAAQSAYYGLVSWIDAEIARLLASLDRNVADRTAVVVTSDHGAHLGELGAFGKHSFAVHAHRVPLIVVHPQRASGVSTDLADSSDLPRTLLGAAGIDTASNAGDEDFGGRDVLASSPPDELVSLIGYGHEESRAFPNHRVGSYRGRGWPRRACIRTRRWRLDCNVRIDGRPARTDERDEFLVDTDADPAEITNLAGTLQHAAAAADLGARLDERLLGSVEPNMDDAYDWIREYHGQRARGQPRP